jgi:broad specificity phosphatase PhoE
VDFFLVRHGEAAASWGESPDPGLSTLGRQQAEAAAGLLTPQIGSDALLLSSPLRRALETAGPLASMLRQSVQQDEVFREIPAPVPLAQRQAWLRQFMQQQWHGQEEALLEWRTAALQRLLELPRPSVIFTHFLVINAVVGQVLDRPETLHFWPSNGSITQLRRTDTGLELVSLGEQMESVVN